MHLKNFKVWKIGVNEIVFSTVFVVLCLRKDGTLEHRREENSLKEALVLQGLLEGSRRHDMTRYKLSVVFFTNDPKGTQAVNYFLQSMIMNVYKHLLFSREAWITKVQCRQSTRNCISVAFTKLTTNTVLRNASTLCTSASV